MANPALPLPDPEDRPTAEIIPGPWSPTEPVRVPAADPAPAPAAEPEPAEEPPWRLNTRADFRGAWLYGGVVTGPDEIEAIRRRIERARPEGQRRRWWWSR